MGVYYKDECVDCGFPCLGNSCPYYKVKHYSCDICGVDDDYVDMAIATDDEAICEDCKHKMDLNNLKFLREKLYEWYKKDWLSNRGLFPEDVDEETGVKQGPWKDTIYVSFEEFLDSEYNDEDYLNYLSSKYGKYKDFEEMIKDYDVEEVI